MRVLEAAETEGRAFYLNDAPMTGRWLMIGETIAQASSPAVLQWRPDDADAWIPLGYELSAGDRSALVQPPHRRQLRVVPAAAGAVVRFEPTAPSFGARAEFADG